MYIVLQTIRIQFRILTAVRLCVKILDLIQTSAPRSEQWALSEVIGMSGIHIYGRTDGQSNRIVSRLKNSKKHKISW